LCFKGDGKPCCEEEEFNKADERMSVLVDSMSRLDREHSSKSFFQPLTAKLLNEVTHVCRFWIWIMLIAISLTTTSLLWELLVVSD